MSFGRFVIVTEKKNKYDVSIIVATYNPDYNKLMRTVKSAMDQKESNIEIIISDDGSMCDYFDEIKQFFINNGFFSFELFKNKENVGTVQNLLNAVKIAKGKYVYGISPGDYFFDSMVIHDLFDFALKQDAKICFGDYVNYSIDKGAVSVSTDNLSPMITDVYNKSLKYYKTAFSLGHRICGATFFRERLFAEKSLEYVSRYIRYTEDTSTTLYALANNIKINYFPRKFVWYECDSGITSKGGKWGEVLSNELINSYLELIKDYPSDSLLKVGLMKHLPRHSKLDRYTKLIKIAFFHPVITIRFIYIQHLPGRHVTVSTNEKERLIALIDGDKVIK